MKKTLIILGFLILGFAPHVFADGFVPLAPIPGLTDSGTVGSVVNSATLANFFNNLYKYLIGIAATLAVIEIIWGGLLYSTTDSVGNKEEGKEKIRMAIFGLVLVLSPVLVFTIINPSILNLSLNLPPIKTLTTPQTGPSGPLPTCLTPGALNCTPASQAVPLDEGTTIATLPTCGPGVSSSGTCTTAAAPACPSGKWYYTTTNTSNIGAVADFGTQKECQDLYTLQSTGKGQPGITVTSSGCTLCP